MHYSGHSDDSASDGGTAAVAAAAGLAADATVVVGTAFAAASGHAPLANDLPKYDFRLNSNQEEKLGSAEGEIQLNISIKYISNLELALNRESTL